MPDGSGATVKSADTAHAPAARICAQLPLALRFSNHAAAIGKKGLAAFKMAKCSTEHGENRHQSLCDSASGHHG
jgi:hypothetical protein